MIFVKTISSCTVRKQINFFIGFHGTNGSIFANAITHGILVGLDLTVIRGYAHWSNRPMFRLKFRE